VRLADAEAYAAKMRPRVECIDVAGRSCPSLAPGGSGEAAAGLASPRRPRRRRGGLVSWQMQARGSGTARGEAFELATGEASATAAVKRPSAVVIGQGAQVRRRREAGPPDPSSSRLPPRMRRQIPVANLGF
jgi:hypothetical protein